MQEMTHAEREHLKQSISELWSEAGEALRMIAHWHRQRKKVPFSRYAAHWAHANHQPQMQKVWPLNEAPKIPPGYSDWPF